jgi:hypothetical protein
MADLQRKSVEPIALACEMAARTMQEFLPGIAPPESTQTSIQTNRWPIEDIRCLRLSLNSLRP